LQIPNGKETETVEIDFANELNLDFIITDHHEITGDIPKALAIIKYYELRNNRVLVLCPKKLRENWLTYRANRRDNILEKDRLNYDVLNHTDLSRYTGHSGDINLEEIYWENYDLIVIDESHNFRNRKDRYDENDLLIMTRYARLLQDVIKKGKKVYGLDL